MKGHPPSRRWARFLKGKQRVTLLILGLFGVLFLNYKQAQIPPTLTAEEFLNYPRQADGVSHNPRTIEQEDDKEQEDDDRGIPTFKEEEVKLEEELPTKQTDAANSKNLLPTKKEELKEERARIKAQAIVKEAVSSVVSNPPHKIKDVQTSPPQPVHHSIKEKEAVHLKETKHLATEKKKAKKKKTVKSPSSVTKSTIRKNQTLATATSKDVCSRRSFTLHRPPTHRACEGYRGVMHIASGDKGAGGGTVFFEYVVNLITYAEMNRLLPWIHLNNISEPIYDELVHNGENVTLLSKGIMTVDKQIRNHPTIVEDYGMYPAAPTLSRTEQNIEYTVEGNGVWECYFEPISDFTKGDKSCESKPIFSMDYLDVDPGIHFDFPWSVHAWPDDYISKSHRPKSNQTMRDWYAPQRRRGNKIVTKYIRFQPHLVEEVIHLVPAKQKCLSVHIRHTDKGGLGRKRIETREFRPYVEAYVEAALNATSSDESPPIVYVATDSKQALDEIESEWPASVANLIRTQNSALRSPGDDAVFEIGSHHRTNTEVLLEIMALSRCQFMLHGRSAVSESAIYLNIALHEDGVDLEDPDLESPDAFRMRVQKYFAPNPKKKKKTKKKKTKKTASIAPDKTKSASKNQTLNAEMSKEVCSRQSFTLHRIPTHHACDSYQGVLHIASGDDGAAGGTVFFQYVINLILYAEMHQLLPWIHLNNVSKFIYDDHVHSGENVTLLSKGTMAVEKYIRNHPTILVDYGMYPGAPEITITEQNIKYPVQGNGVWECYFEPISDFTKGDKSCESKPIFSFPYLDLNPSIHLHAPWSVHAWPDEYISKSYLPKSNQTVRDWYAPQRRRGNKIVKKYIRFQPHMVTEVDRLIPSKQKCLSVHIRHTDKGGLGRKRIETSEFRPYVEAYVEAALNATSSGQSPPIVYVATDSKQALDEIEAEWPASVTNLIRTQNSALRSPGDDAVFEIGSHHRTNTEVLLEIMALSRCQFMLHGRSAVSESAMYLNIALHEDGVDLEDPDLESPDAFRKRVKKRYKARKAKLVAK